MKRLRPGASEIYRVLVPCAVVTPGKHELRIRVRADNRVTFEGACDWRIADAHDRLGNERTPVSCLVFVTAARQSIRERSDVVDIRRCAGCGDLVFVFGTHCHFDFRHQMTEVPFWDRLIRSGRVR